MRIQLVIGLLDQFKGSLGQNSGDSYRKTKFRLAEARGETQPFIGMFLIIIL